MKKVLQQGGTWVVATALGLGVGSPVFASPVLSLFQAGTNKTSDTIVIGTSTYSVDTHLNTGGVPVNGLQYAIQVQLTPPASGTVKYGATPLTLLNNPFTSSDVQASPSAGATVDTTSAGTTALFKTSTGDYAASADYDFVTDQFDTSSLGLGTYTFTPVGQEFTNGTGLDTKSFGMAGTFTLLVAAVPEPMTMSLAAVAGAGLMLRRPRRQA